MSINMKKTDYRKYASAFKTLLKGLIFWPGWHPEVALRYLPVVAEIKKIKPKPSVLDVGSGGLGIAPYLKKKVTGVDIKFNPPYHPMLEKILASALNLPFTDRVFDAVISVDTIEHLNKSQRGKAVSEIIRTARALAVIAVPCGKQSLKQDKKLHRYYRKKFGKNYVFFEEQIKYKLPEEEEMVEYINQAAKINKRNFFLKIMDNENLALREFLMKGWMSENFAVNILFRKVFLLAIPLMSKLNGKPAYRKIFIVKLK